MKLSIPSPCSKTWNNKMPSEQGKFCSACQQEVVDFTDCSLSKIKRYFEQQEGICGRFQVAQLEAFNNRYDVLPAPSTIRHWTAAAVLTAVVVWPSFGQAPTSVATLPSQTILKTDSIPVQDSLTQANSRFATTVTLSGKILDVGMKQAAGLPFATIYAESEGQIIKATQSDFDGNFAIEVPFSDSPIKLVASYVGFPTVINDLVPNRTHTRLVVQMKEGEPMTHQLFGEERILLDGVVSILPKTRRQLKKEARQHRKEERQAAKK